MTQKRLQEVIYYNSETGAFTWIKKPHIRAKKDIIGTQAGGTDGRYYQIQLDGTKYMGHKLAWLYVYGEMPKKILDHRDKDRLNNAIVNLREVEYFENSRNCHMQKNNKTGVTGVRTTYKGYRAFIGINGKQVFLGTYKTLAEAAEVRHTAEIEEGYYKDHGKFKRKTT